MTTWTSDELERIGNAEELEIASRRRDGTLRNPVKIWVVGYGDDLYVRAAFGRNVAWFRGTQVCHEGRITADDLHKNVLFADGDPAIDDQIDAAYRVKYRRYGEEYVNAMVAHAARSATIKLVPL
jgi:hypothetical protein